MRSLLTFPAALSLLFCVTVNAFWRMNCGVIQSGRVDPVVNPGTYAQHAHSIVGGSNIGVNATYNSLVNSACSSCEIQADKSAYWTPLLYYWYPNGSFYEVPHGGSVVYYLARAASITDNSVRPFPEGFMMLSGNKAARSYDNETMTWGNATYPGRPIADRVSFACLTAGPSPPEQPNMFTPTLCVNGMRAQIAFQSCWNGVDLYKSDNSHVAYLSQIDNGVCPPGYPVELPIVFVETNYAVSQVPEATDNSRYVFSQGDPTGFGFHGDFQNGWDMDVQTAAVADCLIPDNFGQVSFCPALAASDTNGMSWNCPEQPPQVGEAVHGLIDKLPGCIEVTYGPAAAPAASMQCGPGAVQGTITSTADTTPRPTASPTPGAQFGLAEHTYMGCYNDTGTSHYRTLNSISTVNYTSMTVEWCQQYCADNGYRYSGVEYAQECHCDNNINPTALNANNLTVNQCTWDCGGTLTANVDGPQQLCGGLSYIMVYNNTNSSFDAFGSNVDTAGLAEPWTPPGGFGSNYLGCYTDGSPRTLQGPTVAWNNMSVTVCADYCFSQGSGGYGFQYYGVEYGSQCWCGNDITPPGSLLTPDTNPSNLTACEERCFGSEPEICGGAGAMSLYINEAYKAPEEKPSIGKYQAGTCLTDRNATGRALQGASMSDDYMTVEKCIKYCLGTYNHYAGVEYGIQCWCGNEIMADTGNVIAGCNATDQMLCPGNKLEFCGGAGFMDLYYSETL